MYENRTLTNEKSVLYDRVDDRVSPTPNPTRRTPVPRANPVKMDSNVPANGADDVSAAPGPVGEGSSVEDDLPVISEEDAEQIIVLDQKGNILALLLLVAISC